MRFYVEGPICPACGTNFQSRYRVLRHLSDRRREVCRSQLVNVSFKTLDLRTVEKLDLENMKLRNLARKEGHTHPIASGSARTIDGKRVGRVRR